MKYRTSPGTAPYLTAFQLALLLPFAVSLTACGLLINDILPTGTSSSGVVEFGASSYSATQTSGSVTLSVNRSGGSSGIVAITYATSNGTATAGTDYTAANGQLTWVSGDTSAKSISVTISKATPFTGSKAFAVVLSAPTGGATLGTPISVNVAITGSGTGSGSSGGSGSGSGPSAVGDLQLVNQGGPGDGANPPTSLTNYQQISWTAATAGSAPIDHYKIYRNGAAYDTSTSTSYADTDAPVSNSPTWALPATVYSYNVSAVDTQGNEGPQASQMSVYSYQNGVSNWENSDYSYGTLVENYSSTAGNPQGGQYDISIDFEQGGFQPYAHPPQAPTYDLEIGAFNYFTIDMNPGSAVPFNTMTLGTVSRLPPGDVFGWHPGINILNYGPAPAANTWATYKVPLIDLAMGTCQFTGSVSGTTLTVTAITSGQPLVDAGGFVTGPGVPTGTYINAYGQNSAIGTFTVAGPGISASTNVPSATMTYQRTSLYKFGIYPDVSAQVYFNNLGFTVN